MTNGKLCDFRGRFENRVRSELGEKAILANGLNHAADTPARLINRDRHALAFQIKRGGQPRDASADDCDRFHSITEKNKPPIRIVENACQSHKNLGIELSRLCVHIMVVKTMAKRQTKTEADLLDHATNNLLRALKQDMLKKEGRVDSDKLRKDGYSDRLITGLKRS